MVKVGIVGSRSFRNLEQVKDYVKSLDKDTIIVSGGVAINNQEIERKTLCS